MQALVKYALGINNMEIREVNKPEPKSNEVLIRVKATGICGTDLKIYDDKFKYDPPVIVGHEFSGIIEKIGTEVIGWKQGDRVISEQHMKVCGVCEYCLTGRRHLCPSKKAPGYGVDGAFAEYICVPYTLLHKISDNLSYEEATLIEPMAVATYAILERTRIEPEDFVVILGCGPIALLALQIIKAEGASKVAVVGLGIDEEFRFKIAKDFGADLLINAQKDNVVEAIYKTTKGIGSDLVIDLSGSEKAILQGFSLMKKDGKFCALGLPYGDVHTPWTYLALKAATITFSYSSNYKSWERCLSMIENKKVKLKQFTKDRYPLDKWEEAFKKARTAEALKVIINL